MNDAPPLRPAQDNTPAAAGQAVRTPEQVVLELPLAGPTSRMFAYGIDVACVAALVVGMAFVFVNPIVLLQAAAAGVGERWADALEDPERVVGAVREIVVVVVSAALLAQVVVETLYFVLFETLAAGRSPGKMLTGLRVVAENGRAIGFPQALARNLLRFIDALPLGYLVGLAASLASPRGQRLGDLAAGTIVVRLDRPPAAVAVDDAPRPGDEAFAFDHAQSRRIGAPEVRLARATLRRVEDVGAAALADAATARAVLARSAAALCARLGHEEVGPEQHAAFLRAVLRAARKQRGG